MARNSLPHPLFFNPCLLFAQLLLTLKCVALTSLPLYRTHITSLLNRSTPENPVNQFTRILRHHGTFPTLVNVKCYPHRMHHSTTMDPPKIIFPFKHPASCETRWSGRRRPHCTSAIRCVTSLPMVEQCVRAERKAKLPEVKAE